MKEHSRGLETAAHLEERLADHGALFHNYDDNGFVVVGDDRIFVVEEEQPDQVDKFLFRKIPFDTVRQFLVELGAPDGRYTQVGAEKVSNPAKPITHIRLFLPTDAVDCYVDADPREVASSFDTLSLEDQPTD